MFNEKEPTDNDSNAVNKPDVFVTQSKAAGTTEPVRVHIRPGPNGEPGEVVKIEPIHLPTTKPS